MLPILGFFLTVTSSPKSKTRFLNTQVSFLDFLAEPPSYDLSSLSLWEWDAEYALGLLVLASGSSQTLQMPGLPLSISVLLSPLIQKCRCLYLNHLV